MRVDSAVEGSIVGATDMSNELMTSAGKLAFSSAPKDMRARSAKDRARVITAARADSMICV